jgi:SAM-dependent methyltransferase
MKRIDQIAAEYSCVDSRQFVEEVSIAHFNHAADSYDATHPDLFYDCVRAWQRLLGTLAPALGDTRDYTVVDIGSGTGFVGMQFARASVELARYIGLEPSRGMHARATQNLAGAGWPVDLRTVSFTDLNTLVDQLRSVAQPLIVTLNSVLHHIVWWEAFLSRVEQALDPGDIFVVAHEPNKAFWVSVRERLGRAPRLPKYLQPQRYIGWLGRRLGWAREGRAPVAWVNDSMKPRGLLRKELETPVLQCIIDYGQPELWARLGFSDLHSHDGYAWYETLQESYFRSWDVLDLFTYMPLGVSWKLLDRSERKESLCLSSSEPLAGSVYCVALQKPRAQSAPAVSHPASRAALSDR